MNDKEPPVITIYTPTYNRAYRLDDLYQSLKRQTDRRFKWLVIDDGSTDNTESLVKAWITKADFDITYVKQANEGKMAKLNYAHEVITTPLCSCVDSDDYLTDNAIELILNKWDEIKQDAGVVGIIGLDVFKTGETVGNKFPSDISRIKYSEFDKKKIVGDKKFIYRTDVAQRYSYPTIKGEKFPAPGYLYRLMDVEYVWEILNSPLCVVEYLDDGISKNKFLQFMTAPHSFCFYRQERIRLASNLKEKFRNAVHYVSSCLFAQKSIFESNNYKALTLIALPFGVALNLYLRYTKKKGAV